MAYRYTQHEDYGDYAAGKVFHSLPGHAAFPVRLASELFQRCFAAWEGSGGGRRAVVYDPCCGGAYHLCTLAFLHWGAIGMVLASDIDAEAVGLAARNLRLLSSDGMAARMQELRKLLDAYGKPSHVEALESAQRLAMALADLRQRHALTTEVFQADAADPDRLVEGVAGRQADIVIADVPYGKLSAWLGDPFAATGREPPLHRMLGALLPVLAPGAVVGIAADKSQTITHERYRRIERFQVGKRRMALLTPLP